MTDHPILFNAEMVLAILDGRKTQTRRPMKPQPVDGVSACERYAPTRVDRHGDEYPGKLVYGCYDEDSGWVSPFGKPGDTLWVRETWATRYCEHESDGIQGDVPFYRADYEDDPEEVTWTPNIHMPKWASRITLDVTDVRVERVQDISEDDCWAEAVNTVGYTKLTRGQLANGFAVGWDAIYATKGFGWDANPWVWVAEFLPIP